MKNGFWDSEANKFTLYGAVFGLLFPLIATVIQAYIHMGALTWEAIVAVQRTDPLLWIIDSAPFFLGLFARFAGWRQDQLKRVIQQKMTAVEVEEDKLEDARQFAGVLTFLGVALIGVVLFLAIIWLQSLISTTLAELPPTVPVENALVSAQVTTIAPALAVTATAVAAAPQIVVLDAPVATPTPAQLIATLTVTPNTVTLAPQPTLSPATPDAPTVLSSATAAPRLDGIRLGVVERAEADCAFFTEVAVLAWQQQLGVNVIVERFATVDLLYAALATPADPQRVDLTLCYLDPNDRAYLRQYPGVLSLVGKAFWQRDANKLFSLRSSVVPAVDDTALRCINNFLANQSYAEAEALTATPAQWIAANEQQLRSWLDCTAE